MTDTHNRSVAPMGENTCRAVGSAQWLLEKSEDAHAPRYHANVLEPYICGQEAFEQIAKDIRNAKGSVEIICWGFDPAMELIRTGTVWPRGETWGGLLRDVAEGKHNAGKPVQVRLLAWYGFLGDKLGAHNLPGHHEAATYEINRAVSRGMTAAVWPGGESAMPSPAEPSQPRDRREVFNAQWYRNALSGQSKHLAVRKRDGKLGAVYRSLKEEPNPRGLPESLSMLLVPTDHQKTILIDYEHEGGRHAVGYVMGLNSVTDYWDTTEHLFDDPRRGASWEGAGDDGPGLKPYQDYACRIQGEALVAVSKNFTDAWNRAEGGGTRIERPHDLNKPPAGLSSNLKGIARHRTQIVRTQPEESDKTIQRLYQQATSFARNYVYVENQYFQYTEWARQLKQDRAGFLRQAKAAGCSVTKMLPLHVIVVIPSPEHGFMVPSTYETVKSLGHADSMPNQDKVTEDELAKARPVQKAQQGAEPLSTAQGVTIPGSRQDVLKELDTLGIRTLIASLWTFDHNWPATQRKKMELAREWEGMPGQTQRHKAMTDAIVSERYREIYIHSKLMLIDDAMFTLGSANLNLRSMAVDAEINVASDDVGFARDLRMRVWKQHTKEAKGCDGGDGDSKDITVTFRNWKDLMLNNRKAKVDGKPPEGFLFPFEDKRTSRIRLG